MVETIYKLIPTAIDDQCHIKNKQELIELLDRKIKGPGRWQIFEWQDLQFVDCGRNLEYVRCPHCYKDLIRWWAGTMEIASKSHFSNRQYRTPCCHKEVSLETLEYCLTCGFAKFIIEIRGVEAFDEGLIYEIESITDVCFMKITSTV